MQDREVEREGGDEKREGEANGELEI